MEMCPLLRKSWGGASGVKLYFVAPDVVRMKDDIKEFLTGRGVEWEEVDDLAEVTADVDVLYQTRIQKERFQVQCGC